MDRDASKSQEELGQTQELGQTLLRRADQVTVAVLVATCFTAILLHWIWQLVFSTSLIEIEQAAPLELEFQVQVNEAQWPELTLLPRIGETLARRIVAYRDQHGPFQNVDQLIEVKGIGPKTMRQIAPFVTVQHNPGPDVDE